MIGYPINNTQKKKRKKQQIYIIIITYQKKGHIAVCLDRKVLTREVTEVNSKFIAQNREVKSSRRTVRRTVRRIVTQCAIGGFDAGTGPFIYFYSSVAGSVESVCIIYNLLYIYIYIYILTNYR